MGFARWGDLPGISFLPLQISSRRAERKGVETSYLLDCELPVRSITQSVNN